MALSDDLRTRVVESVLSGGLSRNAAAKRFKVSIASAVCHVARNCKNAPVRACCCSLFEKHFAPNYQICCNNDNASGCAGTLSMAEASSLKRARF